MTRSAFVVLGLGLLAACGELPGAEPAPLDRFYRPSGLAVHDGQLLVASSNFDLRYDLDRGGTIIAVDPAVDPAPLLGGAWVASFTGEIAVADRNLCGLGAESVAVVASRSTKALFPVRLADGGAASCDGCEVPLGEPKVADPFAVGVACYGTPTRARAYVGYLRSFDYQGWISEYDLQTGALATAAVAPGPVRGFAFDSVRERLWMTALASSGRSHLAWIELAGGCSIGAAESAGGCAVRTISLNQLPYALELQSIALSNPPSPPSDVRRVYLTGRLYDVTSAGLAGGRTTDYGGYLVVADLVENAMGGVDFQLVREEWLGYGASEVRVLPARTGMRDVVAALATDSGELLVYDDETLAKRSFGRDATTGAPVLGYSPWGIAVDPVPTTVGLESHAHLYVGSFKESFVTPIDVPLSNLSSAAIGQRITGGTP